MKMNRTDVVFKRLIRWVRGNNLNQETLEVVRLLDGKKTFPRQHIQRDLHICFLKAQKIADKLGQIGLVHFTKTAPGILIVNQKEVQKFLKRLYD